MKRLAVFAFFIVTCVTFTGCVSTSTSNGSPKSNGDKNTGTSDSAKPRETTLLIHPIDALELGYNVRWATSIKVQSNEKLAYVTVLEDMVITVTRGGYIKRSPLAIYREQGRGGKGRKGMEIKDDDFVEHLYIASTHSYILVFTESGRVHWLKVHRIPQGTHRT